MDNTRAAASATIAAPPPPRAVGCEADPIRIVLVGDAGVAIATRREALRTAHAVIIVYDLSAGEPTARRSLSMPGADGEAKAVEEEEEDEKDSDEKALPPKHGSLGRVRSAWLPVVRATARRGTPVVLAGTKLDLVPPASPVASSAAVSPPGGTPEAGAEIETGGETVAQVGAEVGAPDSADTKPQPAAPVTAAPATVPSDDAVAALQAAQAAVMAKDGGIEVIVICSPVSGCYNVAAVFHYATASVIYPSGPLYHDSSPVLRPRAAAALHAIFHACDVDRDGLLSDAEMAAFQASCLHEPLTDDGVSTVKETLAETCPTGLRPLSTGTGGGGSSATGITPGGFVSLHTIIARNGRLDTLWRVVRSHGYDNSLRRVGDWDPARGLPPPLVPRGGGVARVLSPEAEAFLRRFHAGIVDAATATAVATGGATLTDLLATSGASMSTIDAAFAGSPVHPFRRSLVGGDLDAAAAGEDMSPRAGGGCADVEPHWEEGAPLDTRGWVGSTLETLLPGPVDASARMTEDAWVAAWGVAVATEPDAALTALAHIGYCSVLRPCAAPASAASASTAVPATGSKHTHKAKEHHHKTQHHHGGGTGGATAGRATAPPAAVAIDARRPSPPVLLTAPRRREIESYNVARPLLVAYLFGGAGSGKTQVARALVGAPFAAAASPATAVVPPPPRGEHPTIVGGVWADVHPDWGGGRRLLLVREVGSGLEGPTLASPALEAADVAVLVFDAADADSLDAATSLHRQVVAAAPRLPTVFVAAKADLLDSSDSSSDDSSGSAEDSDDDDDADADAEGQADPDDDSPAARRRAHRVRRRARHAVVADADAYCDAEDLSTAVRVAAASGDPEDGAEVARMVVGVATHPHLACPRLDPPTAADAAGGEDKQRSRRPPTSSTRAVAVKAVVAAAAVAVTVVVAKRLYSWYVSRPPSAAAA
ncbi:hypothetical protein I4F81_007250 [Pyropia yezoensis]|uniref:Uncharacterized protein n=1 Tax=Pyropia yezoensis TaxID=2788 RepID=A0ACC3C333_PYRYE|nr:hypothetical protein I4F81_007250 [Neopyropia yezoensis]